MVSDKVMIMSILCSTSRMVRLFCLSDCIRWIIKWSDALVGGRLVRSLGGWSNVISMRRHGDRTLSGERILGSGDFVDTVIREADERLRYQLPEMERGKKIRRYIREVLKREGIKLYHREGSEDSGWVLLDFGPVIVHVFATPQREYYEIEKLWGEATPVVRIL